MYISIRYKNIEHSYWHVTGDYLQVSSKTITPAVERAVKRFLERQHPDLEIKDEDIKISPARSVYSI